MKTVPPTPAGLSSFTYAQAQEMNLAFAAAMLKARDTGKERFTLGPKVDDTPMVPAVIPRPDSVSRMGSAAALCANDMDSKVRI